jgi:hypothetical protein
MKVKPVLGGWEVPSIEWIAARDRRAWIELPVPGRAGSLFQDLDGAPTRVAIAGSLAGDEPRDEFLEELRGKFRAGEPVTFAADIVTATEVQYVVIEELRFEESAARPDETSYYLLLRESPPPPPPPDPLGGLDMGLLDQAGGFLDTLTGALDLIDGLGSIPDISDPTPPLTAAMDGVTTATESLGEALGSLTAIFGSDD